MDIAITQEHINTGLIGNATDCAIAQAIRQQLSLEKGQVAVCYDSIFIAGKHYPTPLSAKRFLQDFDTNKAVAQPFVLTISPYFSHSGDLPKAMYINKPYQIHSTNLPTSFTAYY